MRKSIKHFIQLVAETLPIVSPVYEFGAYRVAGQEESANLRPIFQGKEYIGADIREGPGVDIVLDLHNIDLPPNIAGTVLICETLEHVEYPRKAISEAYRILKDNGMLIISSAMYFPIHAHPNDYWRFTPEGFKSLLKEFRQSFVFAAGDPSFPHIVAGIAFKAPVSTNTVESFFNAMQTQNPLKRGIKGCVRPFMPPIVWRMYRNLSKSLVTKYDNFINYAIYRRSYKIH